MDDLLVKRLRALTKAGWWVFLIAVLFALANWAAYYELSRSKPEWVLSLIPGVTWEVVQTLWLYLMTAYKFTLWLFVGLNIWITLWIKNS